MTNFDTKDGLEDFLTNTPSGFYKGFNTNGEMVTVDINQGEGMELTTYQDNGWVRINEHYIDNGLWTVTETFDGRWKTPER